MDLVTLLHQIASGRQAGGTASYYRNFLSSGHRLRQIADIQMTLLVVSDETLQISNAQRLHFLAHQAATFAVIFLRANTASDGGQHVVFADFRRCAKEVAGYD